MDSSLKQRLVGAIVLVALAVIFLPMLLDGSGMEHRVEQAVRIPPRPDVPAPAPDPIIETTPEPRAVDESAEREQADAASPPPAIVEEERQPDREAGYAVQAGSFTRETNADALRAQLREAGLDAFVQEGDADGTRVWRVRIGPVASESEAEELRARLESRHGQSGIVVSYP